MRDLYGHRVLQARPGWSGKRVGQWLPRRSEVFLRLVWRNRYLIVQWLPREGYWITSAGEKGAAGCVDTYSSPRFQSDAMKRRQAARPGDVILPALPSQSVWWPKSPALREFLTATKYDDDTPRTPGYVTVRNRATTFEVTVYDPDSGSRLSARAPTLDGALSLVEQLLGVEDAPWEPDRYLMEMNAKTRKKKAS